MKFRVGVDGGGTTTRAVVIDSQSTIVARTQSGSSNLYNLGLEAATQNIRSAIDAALEQSGLAAAQVESWGFALAGASGPAEKSRWRDALRAIYGESIVVDEDVAGALAGALGEDGLEAGGAVLIAGTGANCFGQDSRGQRRRADGWGPLLGDRGSGYWLGESAMRAAIAAQDQAAPDTSLRQLLPQYFDVASLQDVVGIVYAPDFRRDRVAGFVPHVLRAARAGDDVAQDLLRQSGRLLAETARAVLKPLGLARLALTGGLIEHSGEVRQALDEALGEEIETCQPRFEPAVGAALLFAMSR